MAQLQKVNKMKDFEINDLTFELATLKKIQRLHVKTIILSDDDFYRNEVNFKKKSLIFIMIFKD